MHILMKLTVLTIGLIFGQVAFGATISVRADAWWPINGNQPGSAKQGYMVDIAKAIWSKAGHTVDYAELPWKRSLQEVKEGNFDCVVGAAKNDAPDFIFPKESMGFIQNQIFVSKQSSFTVDSIDSLKKVKLAIIGGYSYSEIVDQYINENPTLVEAVNGNNALEQNIKKIIAYPNYALVDAGVVVHAKLKEMGAEFSDKVKLAGSVGDRSDIYIACSPSDKRPNSREYVNLLDAGIAEMRTSGELSKLLEDYGLEDWNK